MTKLGVTGSYRGTARELKTPVASTWREDFLGTDRFAKADGDNLNELWEEDIWGEGFLSEENHKDVVVQKSCEETQYAFESRKALDTKKLRSWLSVEIKAAASDSGPSGLSALSHIRMDGSVQGGWRDGARGRKSTMNIPQLGNNADEGWQYCGLASAPLSAPVEAPYWRGELHENGAEGEDEEEEEVREARLLPPHELLAREYAKSQAMAYSVFEGVGRTLKGMDLRRLRTAVWRQTGFMD